MEKARLFVGTFLDVEPALAVSSLRQMNSELSGRWHLKARFVPLKKLHLTWLFLGDVERELIEAVKSDLKNTIEKWKQENQSFQINYDQLEVWPSLKLPRVVVLESTKSILACPQAETLNSAIEAGLDRYCERSDKVERFKRFRPHLTVCRFSPDANQRGTGTVKRSLADFEIPDDLFPLIHKIETVSLIESHLNAGADGYASIQDIAL